MSSFPTLPLHFTIALYHCRTPHQIIITTTTPALNLYIKSTLTHPDCYIYVEFKNNSLINGKRQQKAVKTLL